MALPAGDLPMVEVWLERIQDRKDIIAGRKQNALLEQILQLVDTAVQEVAAGFRGR